MANNNINRINVMRDTDGYSNTRGFAETVAEENANLNLKFSKFSNPHHSMVRNDGPQQHREEDDENFIVLCRVLVDRVAVLDGDITLEDVEMAIKSGKDTIYSRSR